MLPAARAEFATFKATKFFPALQQLRTLSVLFVVASHMQDPMWGGMHGELGVVVFFVVSGFLITTLLLREEATTGSVSLRGFYLRRAFRILPLYYLVFATFAVLIVGLGLGGQVGEFTRNLPYYLTYQNDFAPAAPFGHSWSLAIEEKFYLVWPVLAFGTTFLRRHRAVTVTALLLLAGVSQATALSYFAVYVPIIAGCVVALAMNSERGCLIFARVARPAVCVPLLLAAAAAGALEPVGRPHTAFGLLFAAAIPGLVMSSGRFGRLASVRPLVWAGSRTYAVYLIHPLCKSVLDEVLRPGSESVPVQVLRFALTVTVSFAGAEVLLRLFEQPLINVGRRFTRRQLSEDARPRATGLDVQPLVHHPGGVVAEVEVTGRT